MGAGSRIAWVTGASSGIGRAVALRLADEGWTVAVSARSQEKLAQLETERPGAIIAYPLDVTDHEAALSVASRIEASHGPVGLAVFSAGRYRRESVRRFNSQDLAKLVTLNVIGTAHCLEAVMPAMLGRGSGRIAVIASVAGYVGLPGGAFNGATKSALITLCEGLYPELRRSGVHLSVINPGFVDTPLTERNDFPMPFMIDTEEATNAILRGLSTNRFEIIFPWKMALAIRLLRALPRSLLFRITDRMVRAPAGATQNRTSGETG